MGSIPLIPAVRELSRLHRQGWTPQILSSLQSLISAIDSSIEFTIDINCDSTAIAKLRERLSSLETKLRKLGELREQVLS